MIFLAECHHLLKFLMKIPNHRNILEVKLVRLNVVNDDGETVKAKTLSEDDLSEFLFDIIKLNSEDCLGIALRTYRYDTKERETVF